MSSNNYHHEEGNRMNELLVRFLAMVHYMKWKDEEGQGLAEYALILVLVAIVCVAALLFLGRNINNVLCNIGANIALQPGAAS